MGKRGFYRRRRKFISIEKIQQVLFWVFQIAVVIGIAAALVIFFGKKVTVVGDSMKPVLQSGDVVLLNKMAYTLGKPDRGDLVVFKPNGNENSHYYVKRVVAVPGDTVQVVDGALIITDEDGENVTIKEIQTEEKIEYAGLAEEAITIPDGEYFVLGDMPNLSEDSRFADVGNVKKEYVAGSAWFRVEKDFGFVK